MSVTLVHLAGDSTVAYTAPYESLMLGTIAACLARRDVDVSIVDTGFDPTSVDELAAHLAETDIVFIDALFRTVAPALDLAENARAIGCRAKLVLVGDAVRGSAVKILESYPAIDAVVVDVDVAGAAVDLVEATWIDPVAGAVIRTPLGSILPARSRASAPTSPTPHRPFAVRSLRERPVLDVLSSAGCASRCSFCMIGSAFVADVGGSVNRWHPRSAEDVAAEVRSLVDRHAVRRFHFADDNFIGAPQVGERRAARLAELLLPLGIAFSFYCRADSVEPELFRRLRSAGLVQVHLGIESGCDSVLKRLRKDQDVATVERALDVLTGLGIRVVPSFIAFEARQSLTELSESLRWMQRTHTQVGFSTGGCIPLPGTRMLDELLADGLVDPAAHWRQAFAPVRYADARVAKVRDAVVAFERAVEARAPRSIEVVATAYHRWNDRLDVAGDELSHAELDLHHTLRVTEVALAMSVVSRLEAPDDTTDHDIDREIADAAAGWVASLPADWLETGQ